MRSSQSCRAIVVSENLGKNKVGNAHPTCLSFSLLIFEFIALGFRYILELSAVILTGLAGEGMAARSGV